MKFKRIHIFGGAGSGKTTLAKAYCRMHNIPHIELDDVVWLEPASRKRRLKSNRDRLLVQTVESDEWVIDGIFWQEWIIPSLERAEKIIVLEVPEFTRHFRVIKRHFQLLKKAERGAYPTFFPTLFELIKLNHEYASGPLKDTVKLLSNFEEKVSICRSYEHAAMEIGV